MISQRLRGMEEDGTKVEGLIPKIQSAFDKYTNGAVSVIDKQNGGLNSTFTILQQLSNIYPTLSAESKAYLNEAVAGNRQNKVLVAIMENWKNVESATVSATNSLGSANAENEKYLKSIEGRISLLSSSTETFWKNLINSDTIKLFVDSMTSLINILDKLVNNEMSSFIIQTGILTAAIYGLGVGIKYLAGTEVALKFATMLKLMTTNSIGLSMGITMLNKALWASPLIKIAAIVAGITLAVKAVDHFTTSLKEQKEIVATLSGEIESLQSEYDKLKGTENRTDDQNTYLKLLKQEIDDKEKLLKIETERAIQQEFFDRKVVGKDSRVTNSGSDNIKESIDDLKKLEDQLAKSKTKEEFDKINEKILNLKLSLTDSLKTIIDYAGKMGGDVPQALIDLKNSIEGVILEEEKRSTSTGDLSQSIKDFYNEVEKGIQIFNDTEESQEKLKKITDDSIKSYEDITSKIQAYNVILDELNSKEGMSSKSKQDIVAKYHELLPYIDNEKELRIQLIEIIKREEEVQLQAYRNMLMYSEDFFNAKAKGNKDLVDKLGEYYDKDLENAKSLAEAKAMVEERLIKNISKQWAKFYQVSAIAGEGYVQTMGQGGMIDEFGQNMAKNMVNEMQKVSGLFDDIVVGFGTPDFKDINMANVKDTSKSTTSTKDNRQFLESIDAEIRAIKLKNDNLLKTEKLLQEQLSLAKDIEGIEGLNEQYRITGELIEHNKIMLESFEKEQDLIHARAKTIREDNSKYDTKDWFDANAEATTSFIQQQNDLIKAINNAKDDSTKKRLETQLDEMNLVFDQIQKLKKAWMESAGEIDKGNEHIKELEKSLGAILDQSRELSRQDYIKKQNDLYDQQQKRLSALADIQETIVAIIRKRGEEEKKQLDDNHKAELDSLEERHKDRKKKYTEEVDTFKKMIQDKIDALDAQYEEEDYLEQLNKEREEANRLQGEIDVLSLDDSLTARNKTIELRKQLADQNEKIAKMQQKKERDLLKKSLQDQLKNHEQDAKDREDIADKSYENEKKRLEEDYNINKEFLDKKYSDEKVYAEARQAILDGEVRNAQGKMVELQTALDTFENKFGKGMGILGDSIRQNLTEELDKAREAIELLDYEVNNRLNQYDSDYNPSDNEMGYTSPSGDYNSGGNSKPSNGGSSSSQSRPPEFADWSDKHYQKYIENKRKWETGDDAQKDLTSKSNRALRTIYWGKDREFEDIYTLAQLINWKGYAEGGKNTVTGLHALHGTKQKPEYIFNHDQFKDLAKLIAENRFTPNVNVPRVPNISPASNMGGNKYDIKFEIAGNMDRSIFPEVQRMIISTIEKTQAQKISKYKDVGIKRPVY